ncbi:acetyl-CoA carboxylase biotin carboxyl carrier protein [Kitasatospora kifunensis]|uniref:Biotin carboxyl carrier protein of acetyl-CoA carboxylase n=1 Tax=Kitasatospora kifunensis TaxID=58351 RepID=A0A7W7VYN5_KITKI|nr:biotin/lipoyl-containing protein [Kitasatospora kifunensis]MBB4927238.1 acetyl-CoA carboxylase biotin carboxyl carrier protein [Kitasatospora kifunensis]
MKPERVEWERRELARREEDRRELAREDRRHAGMNGTKPEPPAPAPGEVLDAVCRNVAQLAKAAPAPPRRIRMQDGQTSVEVEWPDPVAPGGPALPGGEQPGDPAEEEQDTHTYVRAPMVGTFYHASSPESPPFVSIGDLVQPGQPVGILEAMKMMSTITSAVGGKVVEMVAPNAQPVEFDQRLIALEPVTVEEEG